MVSKHYDNIEKGKRIRAEIMKWYNLGYGPLEIVKRSGITKSQYSTHSQLLRASGDMGAPHPSVFVAHSRKRQGTIVDVFAGTDDELKEWVQSQMVDYDLVSDFLRDLVIDAFYESKGK